MTRAMTPLERVRVALARQRPDRVPLLLLLTTHGARVMGMRLRDYFADPAAVAEAQVRMQARYRQDCLYAFYHAALELEAWGSEVLYRDDGPPNAGAPLVRKADQALSLSPPRVADAPGLRRVLETISLLRARTRDVPVIGVVMAPFSLPVMQLGFDLYLEVLTSRPEVLEHLLRINEEFCVAWGNAQLAAGAHALCVFDPCCSPLVVEPERARRTAFPSAQRTLARLKGPVVTHLASGPCGAVVEDLCRTGTAAVGVGSSESLPELLRACRGKLAVFGNLNGVEMRTWDAARAEAVVRETLAMSDGAGFLLSDSHGEIPLAVPEDVLDAVADAARRYGSAAALPGSEAAP